jgi:trans-aconitate methyltransferase
MIERAQAAYPDLDFRVMPATDFHFDTPFDAVFSNAVLHWVLEKEAAIDQVYHSLRPGGRSSSKWAGKATTKASSWLPVKCSPGIDYYSNAAAQPWYFPSLAEYTTLLEKRGFRIQFAAHFDRPTQLQDTDNGVKDWLRMFGSAFFKDIPETEIDTILEEIQDTLKSTHYKNHSWFADYKRLRIEAFKQH